MSGRAAKRVLIVGWDAADWNIIDPLMASGAMPHLKRLVDAGVRADLRTLEPKLSPMLWTSIAAGKTADKHGVLNFVEPHPSGGGVRVVASTTRKTKALWNMVTQSAMRVHTVSWYATQPAEPINGVCVSNLFREGMPQDPGAAWPVFEGSIHAEPALAARLAASRVHAGRVLGAALKGLLPGLDQVRRGDKRPAELATRWAQALSVHAAAMEIMKSDREAGAAWDCMMVFHESIDTIGHHFMELRPPRMEHVSKEDVKLYGQVMDRVYIRHDELLGQLLQAAGPDTSVILISDHGFYSGADRPIIEAWRRESGAVLETRWHRPEGVIVLSGPGFRAGQTIAAPTVLDITPTALAALGLAVGRDMDGRVIAEAFEHLPDIDVIESWDSRPGPAGLHPADMHQDPYEAVDALKQLVELGYMPAMDQDQERLLSLTRRESQCNLGMVYMTTNRHKEALPIFSELVAAKPEEPRYVVPLAQCQHAAGDLAGSVSTLRAYLKIVPDYVDAHILLAYALAAAGDGAAADEEILAIEKEHGSRPAMSLSMAELFSTRQQWQRAEHYLELAQAHEPKNPHIRLRRARVALEQDKFDVAAEHCLDASELQMSLPEAHYLLGAALAWLGDAPNAKASLHNAVTMAPGMLDAWEFLAALAQAEGDASGAKMALGKHSELEGQVASSGAKRPTHRHWQAPNWQRQRS